MLDVRQLIPRGGTEYVLSISRRGPNQIIFSPVLLRNGQSAQRKYISFTAMCFDL